MYGPYLTGLIKDNDKSNTAVKKWYSCLSCTVQWTDRENRSHCFCCGKWGKRGQYGY